MAMDLLGGLLGQGGLGMSNSYCHMCASHYCIHTMQGMADQQKHMSHYIDALRYMGNGSILVSNGSTSTTATGNTNSISVPSIETKKPNKKLLLLRRAI